MIKMPKWNQIDTVQTPLCVNRLEKKFDTLKLMSYICFSKMWKDL